MSKVIVTTQSLFNSKVLLQVYTQLITPLLLLFQRHFTATLSDDKSRHLMPVAKSICKPPEPKLYLLFLEMADKTWQRKHVSYLIYEMFDMI